jgi:hypothetical protein
MATKLSVATVQQALLEADEARKTHYETMKKNGARLRAVGSLNDPSTKITSIKQVDMPKEQERKSGTHPDFVLQAETAGNYVDKMDRGIFRDNGKSGAPKGTPPVSRMRPNQTSRQEQVTPNMQKGSRKSEAGNSQLWPAAEMAGHYVDAMDRGNIFSKDNSMGGGVSAPSAKNLHGTTRPKSSRKTVNMDRNPVKDQPAVGHPSDNYPMAPGHPSKKTWEHVKSGVMVRVNESVKARFDIVSDDVLNKIVENFRRFGYHAIVERSDQAPSWKSDKVFLQALHEAVAARENQTPALFRKLAGSALNRLYHLSQKDFNDMYEGREDFLKTVKTAFSKILENAITSYRKDLNLFVGKARVIIENKMADVEILAEGTDHQMALRLIRNKLMEQFGLDANIKFIFIDGTKYLPEQIKEWFPRVKV